MTYAHQTGLQTHCVQRSIVSPLDYFEGEKQVE